MSYNYFPKPTFFHTNDEGTIHMEWIDARGDRLLIVLFELEEPLHYAILTKEVNGEIWQNPMVNRSLRDMLLALSGCLVIFEN